MKFELKPFQEAAVAEVLKRLDRAQDGFRRYQEASAFSLESVTGSGKTVMATAVMEAILHGSDTLGVQADPTATFLWVTGSPSLNLQTLARIENASDRIFPGQLKVIENDFNPRDGKLARQKVYFLNWQKLASRAGLAKIGDGRDYTFFDMIHNTIKDESTTLYLLLDEAHIGMKPPRGEAEERGTIVQHIVNGDYTHAKAPIVWGISASPQRFDAAMAKAADRTFLPKVAVNPKDVQESGLLKTDVVLVTPDEPGEFDTALLNVGIRRLVESSEKWDAYCREQGEPEIVQPLMVVQIPDKEGAGEAAEDKMIADLIQRIATQFPGFRDDMIAHVLSDRGDLHFDSVTVPSVEPQRVQEMAHVRFLLAKSAITTGWDCPRAEVLLSYRSGIDTTYITQVLGRMVRTPLARTTGDAILDSATCLIPKFDPDAVEKVIGAIMGTDDPSGLAHAETNAPVNVIRKPILAELNTHLTDVWGNTVDPQEVVDFISTLPSQVKPSRSLPPIKRLEKLTGQLAVDLAKAKKLGLMLSPEALADAPDRKAMAALCAVLDGQRKERADVIDPTFNDIMTGTIRQVTGNLATGQRSDVVFEIRADAGVVDAEYAKSVRRLGKVAGVYLERLTRSDDPADPDYLDIVEAKALVAALGRVDAVVAAVEARADALVKEWLGSYRTRIHDFSTYLGAKSKAKYDEVQDLAPEPEPCAIQLPSSQQVESVDTRTGEKLPTLPKHVFADADGQYPVKLNGWEFEVLSRAIQAPEVVAWYRNPSMATDAALRIPYSVDGGWRSVQPDFIVIRRDAAGHLRASVLDPHGSWLGDAEARMKAMASFAAEHADDFDEFRCIDGKDARSLKYIDLCTPAGRNAVAGSATIRALFDNHGLTQG